MLNLLTDAVRRNPYPLYEQVRAASPVAYDAEAGMWMVFDYASVRRCITEVETFSSNMLTAGRGNLDWLIFFDPPRHTKLRALISRAFTPRVIAEMEPRILSLTRELLDAVQGQREVDLSEALAIPLPMRVIAEMLGIPGEEWPRFRRWSDTILKQSYTISDNTEMEDSLAEVKAVTGEMREYLPAVLEERRARPTDDLLSGLVHAEVDGEHLTPDEILGFFQLLLVAGNETTTNLINNAVLSLTEHPEQLASIRARPELLPSAIEETLRYRSPVQFLFRATRREVEMGAKTIPAGELILVMLGSANRDPAAFPDAERFEIGRDPNPHLAFGHGIHFCLGAPLSRLEARIALAALLERAPNLTLASDEPWEPRKALHVLGPSRLTVRLG